MNVFPSYCTGTFQVLLDKSAFYIKPVKADSVLKGNHEYPWSVLCEFELSLCVVQL